jgi:hypothetical protein
MSEKVLVLLVAFQVKHFLADYPLQTPYMLQKCKPYPEYIWPLFAHAGVHAGMTFSLCVLASPFPLMWAAFFACSLASLDFLSHVVIDRLKASPSFLGRWKPNQSQFWNALGADQMMHQFVMLFIVWRLAS